MIDEDEDEGGGLQFDGGPPAPRDMKYNVFNIDRQRQNFEAIKAAGGTDVTHDIYARDPAADTFWFAGKVARTSDVTAARAVARQWHMIEEHACRLRPDELYTAWGRVQLWVAPGDTEMDVSYRTPDLSFERVDRDAAGAGAVRNVEVGFAGELYENGEEGFRTQRTDAGEAVGPEISAGAPQPTEAALDDMMAELTAQAGRADADGIPPME